MPPHSMVLCMVGTGMLWVGWYGFNAGSAVAADGIAANAFTTTTLATAVGVLHLGPDRIHLPRQASILGFCSGAVAGLVVITPACGFVSATGAVIIGVLRGDRAVSRVHEAQGAGSVTTTRSTPSACTRSAARIGAFLSPGCSRRAAVNPNLSAANGAAKANGWPGLVAHGGLWLEQAQGDGLSRSCFQRWPTVVIAYAVKALIGLRPTDEVERQGLDINEHGEEGYVT